MSLCSRGNNKQLFLLSSALFLMTLWFGLEGCGRVFEVVRVPVGPE